MDHELNARITTLLDDLVVSGQETGLQVAAYMGNDLVVDAWSGLLDMDKKQLINGDTLFSVWSVSKGIAATCVHILAERGQLAYDDPVARYWPEFAANGKSAATVRHALTHRIGVPWLPENVTAEMILDWEKMAVTVAEQKPLWSPGKDIGYHAWTFSWIIGELVRRVAGQPIAQFLQQEIFQPLGVNDFYFGVPDSAKDRIATVCNEPQPGELDAQPGEIFLRTLPPQITNATTINRAAVRCAVLPGVGGIGNARAIARHYAMLANMGKLDGVRLLSPERIEIMRRFDTDTEDRVLNLQVRRGFGYYLGGNATVFGDERMGPSGTEFGHPGLGGSIGFADPDHHFAFALTKTLLKGNEERTQSAAYLAVEIIRNYLAI